MKKQTQFLRQKFIALLKEKQKKEMKENEEIFSGMTNRHKITVTKTKYKVPSLETIEDESKKRFIRIGIKKAVKIFGERVLKDKRFLKKIIDHLEAEYELATELIHKKIVSKRILSTPTSPFYVNEIIKQIPEEYSKIQKSILNLIIRGTYKNINEILKKIEETKKQIPKEYRYLEKTIINLIIYKKYKSVEEIIEKIEATKREIPEEYKYLEKTIISLIINRTYKNVEEIIKKIKQKLENK